MDQEYKFHPFLDPFPLMEGVAFEQLKASIKKYGQQSEISLWRNQVVDGRNRYLACQELGIEPEFSDYEDAGELYVFKDVVTRNLHRRHLTTKQQKEFGQGLEGLKREMSQHVRVAEAEEPTSHNTFVNWFPQMAPAEFAELKASIRKHGQREWIPLWDGMIVDGHNRLRACKELGIEPNFGYCVDRSETEMLDRVMISNLHRRHLTKSQRALISKTMTSMELEVEARARKREREARERGEMFSFPWT